nr:DUF3604 domain-containing protein [Acanthopleuribacter pedis]
MYLGPLAAGEAGAKPTKATAQPVQAKQVRAKPVLPKSVYFGDLHMHSGFSLNAAGFLTMNRPHELYRFARGEKIKHTVLGYVQLETPLDFAAVTDHPAYFGLMSAIFDKRNPHFVSNIAAEFRKGSARTRKAVEEHLYGDSLVPEAMRADAAFIAGAADVWEEIVRAADEADQHEAFTAFVGYSWRHVRPRENGLAGLHRNVIFKGAAPLLPWDSFHYRGPEALWARMEAFRARGAGDVIAIPVNVHLSGGWMYAARKDDGLPFDAAYARRRAHNEPLMQIMQSRGASETHTALARNDASADFELLPPDALLLGGPSGDPTDAATGYAREGLKHGLKHAAELGHNPFKHGFVGSTGTHNATPGRTLEQGYGGHHGIIDNTAPERLQDRPHDNPGALTAVWATANSRAAIFEALRRRETYATSGTRLRVRFFGGWDLDAQAHRRPDMVHYGYSQGVSMGADLPQPGPAAKEPVFVIWAYCDTDSAMLDRVQVVKGWLDQGEIKEKVFTDVVVAADNTTCELRGTWRDPAFDKNQAAFYYLRVLEKPVKRWSAYQEERTGLDSGKPKMIQERAWTSPIWYTPAAR